MLSILRLAFLCALGLSLLTAQTRPAAVSWSRYLPAGGFDVAVATAVDAGGDIWVAGHSYGKYEAYGPNEPYQLQNKGASDIFLARFRPFPDGTAQVLFFTWIGGGGIEELGDMKLDNLGRVVLTGVTHSNDFPLAGNAAQTAFGGDIDVFVAVVDPNAGGSASLIYSTYYGGAGREYAKALAVSGTGRVALGGYTTADDLPFVTNGAQPNRRGGTDMFLLTINDVVGGGFSYATYLGGAGTDTLTSIAWDPQDRVWFTGSAGSEDFPVTEGAYNTASSGFFDAVLVGIDPNVSGLAGYLYATLLGGQGNDEGRSLLRQADGSFLISGLTFSLDFPIIGEPLQNALAGSSDLFITRLDPRLSGQDQIRYSTYFGGSGTDIPYSMTAIGTGSVAIAGYSMSGLLPTTDNALQRTPKSGFAEGMVAVLSIDARGGFGRSLVTYFGGSSTDVINSVSVDPVNPGSLIFAGYTTSADLATTDGTIRENPAPSPTAFITRINQ